MSEPTRAPGARLRSERERRGLSVQKAAVEMRLDAWVIEALEGDQYERVGPAVYAKGHLKKYAGMLAIPWEEVVAAYDSLHPNVADTAAQPPAVRLRSTPQLVNNLPSGQIAAAAAFVLIVAGVLWWRPWQQRAAVVPGGAQASAQSPGRAAPAGAQSASAHQASTSDARTGDARTGDARAGDARAGDQARAGEAVAVGEAAGADQPTAINGGTSESAGPSANVVTAAGAAGTGAVAAEAGAGRARLRLSFSTDSWVDVHDAAGKRIFSGYGRANSVKTIAGEAPLRVYLGYANGVQLEINEHAVAIGRPFVRGDVARFEAGADGVLRSYPNNAQPRG